MPILDHKIPLIISARDRRVFGGGRGVVFSRDEGKFSLSINFGEHRIWSFVPSWIGSNISKGSNNA